VCTALVVVVVGIATQLLEKNVKKRLTAEAALKHPWLSSEKDAAAQPHLSLEVHNMYCHQQHTASN
jgi:hypothetical protein